MLKIIATALLSAALLAAQSDDAFVEKPYLQLGDAPKLSAHESLMLLWHADPTATDWKVELKTSQDKTWRTAAAPKGQAINAPGIPTHVVYRAQLANLVPGEEFQYRVLKSGKQVFAAAGRARKSATQPQRFVLFGDCSQGTPGQRAIAYQASLVKPDYLFITGDIVYSSGRISEYRSKFFPVYNPDEASPEVGAPLTRSVPFIAAPGNHDTALQNFNRFPDALAYFLYWDQPMNGFTAPAGCAKCAHKLTGNDDAQAAFLESAGARYPRMANFSFDYGNVHWTVLDSNTYTDWNEPALREWVAKDLAANKDATFRFVAFHHPGFNSAKTHLTDQWMRTLAPVFEAGNVDIVFSGHVHNYQRSFPMTFVPKPQPDGKMLGPKGEMAGDWTLDKAYGNGGKTKPKGPIYIVSGGGGAGLYNPEMTGQPDTWQPFTDKYIADHHSFTVADIQGKTLKIRQILDDGKEVDSFQLNK